MEIEKKHIVFIESKPTVYNYKIARTLKLSGEYKTILVSFSKVDEEFYRQAYDEFHVLEWSHKINFRNFVDFFRKLFGMEGRKFFNELKNKKPYLFQVTGPDLFTFLALFFLRKNTRPKVYFAYDIWGLDKRNFLFTKKPGIKGIFQKILERFCFNMASGVLHKGYPKELKFLDYSINCPDISFIWGCFDEWTYPLKKERRSKEINLGYAGGPLAKWKGRSSFMEVTRILTSQNIHLHTYGPCFDSEDDYKFSEEDKKNNYYHMHERTNPDEMNEKLSQFDYGILPDFYDGSKTDISNLKTEMAGKIINYIEAGLPIIINRQLTYMAEMIEKYGIGFCIDFDDLKNLGEILGKKDYKKMCENVEKFQKEFLLSKQIKKLEDFYKILN